MDLEDLLVESSIQLASLSRQAAQAEHPTLIGDTREILFRDVLGKNLLPARYGIGNGRVVGIDGRLSREVDIVFYDAFDCPRFAATAENAIYPSLGVHGIAEIKSTLDKTTLEDSLAKLHVFKDLYSNEQSHSFGTRHIIRPLAEPKPFGMIFAYRALTSLETLLRNLTAFEKDVGPALRCDLVVVHEVGLLARTYDGLSFIIGLPYPGSAPNAIAIASQHKTLFLFYQILSAMLVSVQTFPVNPSLYQRVTVTVDGHILSGQIREINATTRNKESLKVSYMRSIIRCIETERPTTYAEAERLAFVVNGLDFLPMGEGEVWIYDPERQFPKLEFAPKAFAPGMPPVRSLASSCLVVLVDDKRVLVPKVYSTKDTVEVEER
jgi:hypothetical protein